MHRVAVGWLLLFALTVIACESSTGGVEGDGEGEGEEVRECSSAADCLETEECAGPGVCRTPGIVGDCCFGPPVGRTCPGELPTNVNADSDGCADGFLCIGEVATGIDGGPRDPICVSETDRGEGERCNVGGTDCQPDLVCQFGQGICRVTECEKDDDCANDLVCKRGAARQCPGICEEPAELGEECFRDAVGECGLVHACKQGLDCSADGLCI